MNRNLLSIIFLALLAHLCVAEIVMQTSEPEHLTDLYDAAIDILMTCYGDPGNAIGIVSDFDGGILKALRSKYFIPVVLTNAMIEVRQRDLSTHYKLQIFVIGAASQLEADYSVNNLRGTKWWNQYAKYLFIDATPNYNRHCAHIGNYVYLPFNYGLLDAQFICYHHSSGVLIWNSNPFTHRAPPVWKLAGVIKLPAFGTNMSIFARRYQKGGQACEALNFAKTIDLGGWPLHVLTRNPGPFYDHIRVQLLKQSKNISRNMETFFEAIVREEIWFIENIERALNARIVIDSTWEPYYEDSNTLVMGIHVRQFVLSIALEFTKEIHSEMIIPMSDVRLFAVTQHTDHMSQLKKILSVIDQSSRIGMCIVYLITFLFFKIFMGQAVVPALLNLVRLTCNTGLPKLPQNLAPTMYLACLLMFVVTLQGIYTGNLAALLTTTIAYRNVETKWDIAHLGYTVYIQNYTNAKFAADPVVDGHVIQIPEPQKCIDYVLREPLATCVAPEYYCVSDAIKWNLHVSRDPMVHELIYHLITPYNPLGHRLESIIRRWTEHGLRHTNRDIEKLRLLYLNDDEVKKNTDRRVMTLTDLCFAFVILGVGLLCSLIRLIGEIVICKINLKIAKRRKRVRARLAWGVKKNYFLSFPSFKCRFNVRGLFSKRR